MERNICRLCFDEKNHSIGIFTANGFLLGVASAIRMHILDEVSEDDNLPKFVCTDCWTKLSDFNKFYNAVDEARENYLNPVVKKEAVDETEVNCTVGERTADVVVKSEPMDFDTAVDKDNPPKLEDDPQEKYLLEIGDNSQENPPSQIEDDFRENDLPEIKYENELDENVEFDPEEDIDENNTICDEHEETTDAPAEANEFTPSRVIVLPRIVDVQSVNQSVTRVTEAKVRNEVVPHISKSMNMTCEKCNLPIKTLSALIKHYQDEHKEERILMNCCSTKLKIQELLDHMEYHKNPERYRCIGCKKKFTLRKYLNFHMSKCEAVSVTRDKTPKSQLNILCDLCGQSVNTLIEAVDHHSTAHRNQLGVVRCCDRKFALNDLRDHLEYHKSPDKFKCYLCSQSFMLTMGLKNHLKCHLKLRQHDIRQQSVRQHNLRQQKLRQQNERQTQKVLARSDTTNKKTLKPYPIIKCQKCPAILPSSGALTMHTRKCHESAGAKPVIKIVKCPKCPTILQDIDALRKHIKVRHDYSDHICPVCGNDYKTAPRLKEHMVKHTGEYLYSCNYCPKVFKFSSGVCRHYKADHPAEWSADREANVKKRYGVKDSN